MIRRPPNSPLFPYPPLSRPRRADAVQDLQPESLAPALVQRLGERLARREAEPNDMCHTFIGNRRGRVRPGSSGDRKSTRLNSSHLVISYAVFCLKKKKIKKT